MVPAMLENPRYPDLAEGKKATMEKAQLKELVLQSPEELWLQSLGLKAVIPASRGTPSRCHP
jgi:hypothetical protein